MRRGRSAPSFAIVSGVRRAARLGPNQGKGSRMRRLALASLLVLSTGSVLAAGEWHVPPCDVVTGTKSLAITSDDGATLVLPAHRLKPTSYAMGIAVLYD